MDWDDALAWIDRHINYEKLSLKALLNDGPSTPRHAARKLERVRVFLDLMGDPHRQYPLVHITGTDGKSSTSRMISALLAARGLSVGTHVSPALEREHVERLLWNDDPISEAAFGELIGSLAELEPLTDHRYSYFELMTVASYRWFADIAVDVAVVEVGLGGRWDATNVADATVAVVTNVRSDHLDVIGPTRADVAYEKSGIVKPESVLVLGETDPDLFGTFEAAGARELWLRGRDFDCVENRLAHGGRLLDLKTPSGIYEGVFVPLHGAYQGDNAACALAAVEAFFDEPLSDEVVHDGFAAVKSPGRMEVMRHRPLVIIDGAHSAVAASSLAQALDEEFHAVKDRVLVVGFLGGHDPAEVLAHLDISRYRHVITCAANWPRAMPPELVADAVRSLGGEPKVASSVAEAVEIALSLVTPDDMVLITGSLYAAGEARPLLREG